MKSDPELKKIEQLESKILKEEEKIEKKEAEILTFDKSVTGVVKDLSSFRSTLVRRIAKHKFIYTLVIALGVVMVWRGLWDLTESLITSSIISLLGGILLLWLIKKYTEIH